MTFNDYWILEKTNLSRQFPINLYDKNIVEITEDGLVYFWPYEPVLDELCDVCRNYPQLPDSEFEHYKKLHCRAQEGSMQPCSFAPVELIEHQDIDDFMIDGSCLTGGGYFYNLDDFLYCCNIPASAFKISHLGQFVSIRSARKKLKEYLHN